MLAVTPGRRSPAPAAATAPSAGGGLGANCAPPIQLSGRAFTDRVILWSPVVAVNLVPSFSS